MPCGQNQTVAPPVVFSNSTPSAPGGGSNVTFQQDVNTGQISAYTQILGGAVVKTASYSATSGDLDKLIVFNSSSAVTYTLLNPPSAGNWGVFVENIGTGALTINPNGLQIDGSASSLTVSQNQGVYLTTDGTNYFTERGLISGQPYDTGCYLIGKPGAGATVYCLPFARPVTFPGNFGGAQGLIDPTNGANPTATATYTVKKTSVGSTTSIGTIVISTSGVFSFTTTSGAAQSFAAGDALSVIAPGTQDATLSGASFTLTGTR